jgi:cytochrome c553
MRREGIWLRQFVARACRLAHLYVETRNGRTRADARVHLADPIRHVILSRFDACAGGFRAGAPIENNPESTMTRALLLAVALSIALPAAAADKGDAEAGKLKVYTCAGCHGIPGWKNPYPNYHVPKIGGQNYDYLVAALTEYKKGERSHPTMRAQGESLSEQDIRDIATYLSSITP